MTTVTHEPLCSVSYCPARSDPDWHACLVCENPAIEHHHTNGRGGMGGSKRLRNDSSAVVPLCRTHHDQVSLNKWTDFVREIPGMGRLYFAVDIHGVVVVEKALGESTSGGEAAPRDPPASRQSPPEAGASEDSEALDAGREDSRGDHGEKSPSFQVVEPAAVTLSPSFTKWTQQGETLRNAIHAAPWAFGDWAVVGEDHFGEKAWNEISKGFDRRDYQKVRNWIWVARSIPPSERFNELSWSHHRAVAHLPPAERRELLGLAVEKGLDRDGLAGLLPAATPVAEKPKVLRFTIEDLRERAEDFTATEHRTNGRRYLAAFLEWLAQ